MAYMVAAAGHMDPLSTRLSCALCKEWMNAIDDIPLTGDPSITNQPAATFSCLERERCACFDLTVKYALYETALRLFAIPQVSLKNAKIQFLLDTVREISDGAAVWASNSD
jgi:hypothetical protein